MLNPRFSQRSHVRKTKEGYFTHRFCLGIWAAFVGMLAWTRLQDFVGPGFTCSTGALSVKACTPSRISTEGPRPSTLSLSVPSADCDYDHLRFCPDQFLWVQLSLDARVGRAAEVAFCKLCSISKICITPNTTPYLRLFPNPKPFPIAIISQSLKGKQGKGGERRGRCRGWG